MASFPTLKTGAVTQYPLGRSASFQNDVLRFLDGTEQRYRDSASPQHAWVIALEALDEEEWANVDNFFTGQQGSVDPFSFQDPWTGVTYPSCRIDEDSLAVELSAALRGKLSLRIVENRAE